MPRRKKFGSSSILELASFENETMDENEMFIQYHLCGYLSNIIRATGAIDKDFIEFAIKILGENLNAIADEFSSLLDQEKRIMFSGYIEGADDSDDVARAFIRVIVKSDKNVFKVFSWLLTDAMEKKMKNLPYKGDAQFERNIKKLSKMLGLTEQEEKFLTFLVVMAFSDDAETYFTGTLKIQSFSRRHVLAHILKVSKRQLDEIFAGRMAELGIIDIDRHDLSISGDYLKLFENPDADALPDALYKKVAGEILPLESHLVDKNDLDYVLRLLGQASETSNHILLFGPPGTGKTSFAQSISEKIGADAYEILHSTDNNSSKRRVAITACMNMMKSNGKAVIIVDEADNILNTTSSWFFRGEVLDKGWLNRIMEEPGPNFIWITNKIEYIESSVMRRFAYSIPFKPFGIRERACIFESVLKKHNRAAFYTKTEIKDVASQHNVSAGPMDTAVKKAIEIGVSDRKEFHSVVSRSLLAHERLLNEGFVSAKPRSVEKTYDLSGLNVQGDMNLLMSQLEAWSKRKTGNGKNCGARLLFYGPPGTGKSETAKYIATRLKKELHVKNASDIIDPYLGVTERHIKEAFQAAMAENAVLVFDEADTFLFPRGKAQKSWEISHTNEFLAQMERYNGILICTTNRFSDMDEASVRRFTHKMGFDFLKSEDNALFYKRILAPLCKQGVAEEIRNQVCNIKGLAPGDFSSVRDRFSFFPKNRVDHKALLEALQDEARAKQVHKGEKSIGFGM